MNAGAQFVEKAGEWANTERPAADAALEAAGNAASGAVDALAGGLGIFLVKQMMDGVSYSYEDGKNTLTIMKNLQ